MCRDARLFLGDRPLVRAVAAWEYAGSESLVGAYFRSFTLPSCVQLLIPLPVMRFLLLFS